MMEADDDKQIEENTEPPFMEQEEENLEKTGELDEANDDEAADKEDPDIHPEATFGDVEDRHSLPVVSQVTSLASVEEKDMDTTEAETEVEHENEEIEDMFVPHTDNEYSEDYDVISATGLIRKTKEPTSSANSSADESCEFCHILIPNSMMEDHLRIHKRLDEPLPCPKSKCTNEFLTAFDLKNHLLSIHPNTKDLIPTVYNCGECGKEMSMLSAFQVHCKHRHPNMKVACTKELVLTRTKEGEFVCPVCVKTFQTRKSIVKHFNDVHQLGVKSESTIIVGSDSPQVTDEAESEAASISNLPLHRQSARLSARSYREPSPPPSPSTSMLRGVLSGNTMHGPVTVAASQQPTTLSDEPIVCPSCNEVYFDMAAFKRHYYRHSVRYTCRVCNKKIMGMAEYREHCGKHISRPRAPGEVKRTCPYCGKSFIDMKVHLKKHESSCEICNLQFVHLNNMNRHYLDVHGIDLSQFAKMPDGPDGRKMNTSLTVKLDGYHKTLESIERFEAEASAVLSPVTVKTERMDVTCEFCALTYPSEELYKCHVVTHNQKCKLCQVIIDHEQNIRPHLKTAHGINDVDNVASLFEQTIFVEMEEPAPNESLEKSQDASPPRVGIKREASREEMAPAKRKPTRDDQGRAECKICYRKVIDLNAHMNTHNIKCSLCDYVSIHRFNLRPHMRQSHGLNDDEIDALIEDIIANPVQVWDIPAENRLYNKPASQPIANPEPSVSPANSSPVPSPREVKLQCKLCTKQFSAQNMKRHMASSHNVKCGRCGKFFVHQASIYSHMKNHHDIHDYEQIRRETVSARMTESDEDDVSSASLPLEESEPDYPPDIPAPKVEPVTPVQTAKPRPSKKAPTPSPSSVPTPKASTSGSTKAKKCKVCKQVFDDIISHMNTHYKPCPLCATQFHPQGFRLHAKQKHGITDPMALKSLEEDSSDEEGDESADKDVSDERDMTPDSESIPSPEPAKLQAKQKTNQSKTFPVVSAKCKYCNKLVRDLHLHMSTRHNLKCLICSNVIKHYGNAKTHMIQQHGIDNPDLTELTESMYELENQPEQQSPLEVSNSVLDLSREATDSPDERIRCEFCDSSFKNRKYYSQHCKNIHKIKLPSNRKFKSAGSQGESDDDETHQALPDLLHVMDDLQYSK